MYLIFGLSTLVLLGAIFDETSACGGGRRRSPPPCHWYTCRASYGAWSGANPADGQCVRQRLPCHHHKQRHQRNGGCPGTQHCSQRDQYRNWCKCKHYKQTTWASWTQMPGQENLECKQFERKMSYIYSHSHYNTHCSGIRSSANPIKEQARFCDCKHFTEISWGAWEIAPGQENKECKKNVRKMKYQQAATTVEKVCPKHKHDPEHPKEEHKEVCYKCPSYEFTYENWSSWEPTNQMDGNCVVMKRIRRHSFKPIMVAEEAPGKCPAMPAPKNAYETKKECFKK